MADIFKEIEDNVNRLKITQDSTRQLIEEYNVGQFIPFEMLSKVTVAEPLMLAEKVVSYRIPSNSKTRISFVVEFDKCSILRSHYHDCGETIKILRGELFDLHINKNIDPTTYYPATVPHELYSPGGALIMVYFER